MLRQLYVTQGLWLSSSSLLLLLLMLVCATKSVCRQVSFGRSNCLARTGAG